MVGYFKGRSNIRILSKENVPKVEAEGEEMVQVSIGLSDVLRFYKTLLQLCYSKFSLYRFEYSIDFPMHQVSGGLYVVRHALCK